MSDPSKSPWNSLEVAKLVVGLLRLLASALDCGYAITDELFKLSGPGGRPQEAESIVDARCPTG